MVYSLSPGVLRAYPALDEILTVTKLVACRLDHDIHTLELRVEVRKAPQPLTYYGWAFPVVRLHEKNRNPTYHKDGLIRMRIGSDCQPEDVVRLYAHELRHIGQFHRGRERFGSMTVQPLDDKQCEADAVAFEDVVLKAIF